MPLKTNIGRLVDSTKTLLSRRKPLNKPQEEPQKESKKESKKEPKKVPQKKPPKKTPILFLSESLLQQIHDNLPPIDKICLALSCKLFFNQFSKITEHKEFTFPHLLKIKDPRKCINRKEVPRNQLLLRLETKTWLYCGACLKLHRREQFKNPVNEKPLQRRCSDYAGIVDLCPCISLTGADRKHIIHLLTSDGSVSGGPFEIIREDEGACLRHACDYSASRHWDTSLELYIGIDDDLQLVVSAFYFLYVKTRPRVNRRAEPVFACPHTDLTMLAGWFDGGRRCKYCETWIEGASGRSESPAVFEVIRLLGVCEGLDDCGVVERQTLLKDHEGLQGLESMAAQQSESLEWFQQSRFTSEAWDDYMAFW
jgi:hypothetical protein